MTVAEQLETAGGKAPTDIDGRSFLSVPNAAAILKRYHARPAEELYDLTDDPGEQKNVATDPQHSEHLAALRTELSAWIKEISKKRLPSHVY